MPVTAFLTRPMPTCQQAGDVLILTKPLGVGVMTTALKKGLLPPEGYDEVGGRLQLGLIPDVTNHCLESPSRLTHSPSATVQSQKVLQQGPPSLDVTVVIFGCQRLW